MIWVDNAYPKYLQTKADHTQINDRFTTTMSCNYDHCSAHMVHSRTVIRIFTIPAAFAVVTVVWLWVVYIEPDFRKSEMKYVLHSSVSCIKEIPSRWTCSPVPANATALPGPGLKQVPCKSKGNQGKFIADFQQFGRLFPAGNSVPGCRWLRASQL